MDELENILEKYLVCIMYKTGKEKEEMKINFINLLGLEVKKFNF